MEEGAFDTAVSTLERTIAQMPAYAPAHVLLARAYEAQERWADALTAWQNARFFAPNSPVVEAGLLRVLDRYEADAEDAPPEHNPASDPMDRLADELFETIRDRDTTEAPLQEDDEEDDEEDAQNARTSAASDTAPNPPASPIEELAQRLPAPNQPLPDDVEDLDRLIDELEHARIDPQPDLEAPPPPNLDNDIEDMVSETLARIYISQKQYAEAARVYVRLAEQDPEQEEEYLQKAADMRLRASEQEGN